MTFHYIYPPLSIGISLAIIFMEAMFLKTKNKEWEKQVKFWLKVFALTFALGVGTGIPLQFSMGSNWSRYSKFIGDVSGSLVGIEGIFAFMIEAGFLGILLFGWNRVSKGIHFLSTIMVSLGAHFSAIWIVSLNSWMHTPTGYRLVMDRTGNQVAQVTNWWEMFLNPVNLSSISHVLLGAWLTGVFLIISIAAYYLHKGKHLAFAKKSMKVATLMGIVSVLGSLVSADTLARKVAHYNPEKYAALEGVYRTVPYTPAYTFGWVDAQNQTVHGMKVPGLLSWLTYHHTETPVKGLDQFPKEHWPNVPVVFQIYHLMIMMWGLMAFGVALAAYMWWKNKWKLPKFLHWYLIASVAFPQIANIAGWYTSCIGRQPWIVYNLLKTSDAYSPQVTRGQLIGSLTMFVALYSLFFVLFLVLLDRKIKHGPDVDDQEAPYRDVYQLEDKPHG